MKLSVTQNILSNFDFVILKHIWDLKHIKDSKFSW